MLNDHCLPLSHRVAVVQTYKSGILKAAQCGKDVDHCVQAVGYNTGSAMGDYWIVRNSWNTDWGIAGYIYLALVRLHMTALVCALPVCY